MNRNRLDPIQIASRQFPDSIAFSDHTRNITYSELEVLVHNACARFKEANIRPGQVVAVLNENSLSYAIAFWATFRYGLTFMPLNCRLSAHDWEKQLQEADCRVLLYGKKYKSVIDYVDTAISLDSLLESPKVANDTPNDFKATISGSDAVIMFSSGSTGKPRGIALSRENLYYSAIGANKALALSPTDTWVAVLPFFHIGGLSILFRAALAGASVLLINKFSPSEVVAQIENGISTYLSVVPTMLRELLDMDNRNALRLCKAIILGGAGFDKQLRQQIAERHLPVLTTYGMTETASMVTLLPLNQAGSRLETAGVILPHRELMISGKKHICVRGKILFSRYLDDNHRGIGDNGWFDTGDIGAVDEEGYLYVVGRADNMVISGGENIDLNRIRESLLHISHVKDAVVLSRRDRKWGHRPVAFVVLAQSNISEEEIREVLVNKMGEIYTPDVIRLVDSIPLTASGKHDLVTLRELYTDLLVENE